MIPWTRPLLAIASIALIVALTYSSLPEPQYPQQPEHLQDDETEATDGEYPTALCILMKDRLAAEVLAGRRPLLPVVELIRELNARQPVAVRVSGMIPSDPDVWARMQLIIYVQSHFSGRASRYDAAACEKVVAALEAELEWELATARAYGTPTQVDHAEMDAKFRLASVALTRGTTYSRVMTLLE